MARWMVAALVCAAFQVVGAARAQAQQRWILAGDSIQAGVFPNAEFGLIGGDAAQLTAAIVMQQTGVSIQNISSPGARMTNAGFFPGLVSQTGAVQFIDGFFGATGIIITIGVNDSGATDLDPGQYLADYTNFAKAALNLGLKVICVPPLNEPNEPIDANASRRFLFQLLTV
jgi:hypothetical protein